MFDFWSFVQPGTDFGRVFDLKMSFDRLLDPIQIFGRVFNLRRSLELCCRSERDSARAPFKTNLGRVCPGRDFRVCLACGNI